ncbi:glycosyl transferase family 90-domain-containing protein [Mycena maculata]|uniref:Glycosyl transferase family 90-domain-containing protein n=1 Tax=Mycena maculata TaxID=230809 RepID=A0AAD7JVS6_9AGAR|nr:glycosyl transferase family 90-domain-containing protein [Mycena maculata]
MNRYSRAHPDEDQLLPHSRKRNNNEPTDLTARDRTRSCRYWTPFLGAFTLFGVFAGVLYIPSHRIWHPTPTNISSEVSPLNLTKTLLPLNDSVLTDGLVHPNILALYAHQSRTLEQASARYYLKSGRAPPPSYDKWFAFAQENNCLIDEYDRIQRDFEPFYQLARDHPAHFQEMIDSGRDMMLRDPRGMITIRIRDGDVHLPKYTGTPFDEDLQVIVEQFVHILPDMEFLLNDHDEPRVVFDVLAIGAQKDAMRLRDPDPFRISPVPSADFFRKQSGCDRIAHTPSGFVSDPVDDVAFLRSSSASDFTTDLWPLLSMAKISPCFSDILFPGPYYYDQSRWSSKFLRPNDIAWENKTSKLYWRGASTGGRIYGDNYRAFPRFRLVELGRNHSELIDARMTTFAGTHCTEDCDAAAIEAEYDIEGPAAPKEAVYGFKYLLDVDGDAFSGRFLGLLRSGSLVFKSTAFEEYFTDWLRPFEHYIPVRPDLGDLVDKVQWARDNEAEARAIQEQGMQFAERVMTDRQNDCYFAAVLLEWGRLQGLAGNVNANETVNGMPEAKETGTMM